MLRINSENQIETMTENEFKTEARRIRQLMVNVAKQYLSDADEAEDMVQDILLKLWQMRGELRSPLNGIASVLVRNHCIDVLRRRPQMVAVNDVFYEEQSVEDERLERIVSIMNSLPTMQQTIVRLRHMEGMEMSQIAELTGSSEVAVRKALSRARKAIKEQFLNHKN